MDGPIGRPKHEDHQISVRKLRETRLKRRLGGRPEILHTDWPISKLQNFTYDRLAFGFEISSNRGNKYIHAGSPSTLVTDRIRW